MSKHKDYITTVRSDNQNNQIRSYQVDRESILAIVKNEEMVDWLINNTNGMIMKEDRRRVMSKQPDNAVVLNALMMYPNGKQLVDKVSQGQMTIEQASYEALRTESEAINMVDKVAEVINKNRR